MFNNALYVGNRLLWASLAGLMTMSVQAQESEAERELRSTVETQKRRIDNLERQVEATADAVERVMGQRGGAGGGGQTATRVGGYAELHYNHLDNLKMMDLHRAVILVSHRFNEDIRFFTEWDLEHAVAGDGEPGELEVEQAYLEFAVADNHTATAGVLLMPVGIMNQTHEPPTFYGVERNPVETQIIPTTWREGGAGLKGRLGRTLNYHLTVTNGMDLPTAGADAFTIRDGRQHAAKAQAEHLAYTGALEWVGRPGLQLGAALQYQNEASQQTDVGAATLLETHVVGHYGKATLKALYARWDLDSDGAAALGRDQQQGWYVEPSYKVTPKLGVFARFNRWDTAAGTSADTAVDQVNAGINYWPHPDVVLKADLQQQEGPADGFHLGVGLQF